jgi:hypothetical protein
LKSSRQIAANGTAQCPLRPGTADGPQKLYIHDIKRILQDKQFHLQLKSEQKDIIQNVLEGKIQWQWYPRASERAFNHLTLRKWCYTRVQHDFHIDPIISPCQFIFQPFVTWHMI